MWYVPEINSSEKTDKVLKLKKKKKLYGLFFGWGSTVSRLQSHYEETVYFLPFSCQEFLVFNWSILEGWVDWESSALATRPLLQSWRKPENLSKFVSWIPAAEVPYKQLIYISSSIFGFHSLDNFGAKNC